MAEWSNGGSDTTNQGYIDRLKDIATNPNPTKTDLADLKRIKGNADQSVQNALHRLGYKK